MSDMTRNPEVEQLRSQLEDLRASDPTPHVVAAKQQASDTITRAAAKASDAVATPIREGVDRARDAVASARRAASQLDTQKDNMVRQVRNTPLLALGTAVVAGYVFGRIVR